MSGCCRAAFPYGVTGRRELVAVAVAQIYCDPVVRDRFIDAALEIAIAHIEKIIALKDDARRYPSAVKPRGFGGKRPRRKAGQAWVTNIQAMSSITLNQNALAVWRLQSILESYPPFPLSDVHSIAPAHPANVRYWVSITLMRTSGDQMTPGAALLSMPRRFCASAGISGMRNSKGA